MTSQSLAKAARQFVELVNTFVGKGPPSITSRVAWLESKKFTVYVRYRWRLINEGTRLVRCVSVDIANVVINPPFQRKGLFSAMVRELESALPKQVEILYVESIMHPWLVESFIHRGYVLDRVDSSTPSVFKKLEHLTPRREHTMLFFEIKVGTKFYFEGDVFVKTDSQLAWELRDDRKYKLWTFKAYDVVEL